MASVVLSVAMSVGCNTFRDTGEPGKGEAGAPEVLVSDQEEPRDLVVDRGSEGFVYWVNKGDNTINRVTKGGSASETLAVGVNSVTGTMTGDASRLYWAELAPGPNDRLIGSIRKDGDDHRAVAAGSSAAPAHLTIQGTLLWFIAERILRKLPKTAIFDTGMAVVGELRDVGGITVGGASLYLTRTDAVVRLDSDTESLVHVTDASGSPGQIVEEGGFLLWVETSGGRIIETPLTGGVRNVLAENEPAPVSIAADEEHIYWINSGDGTVRRMPRDGGMAESIATDQLEPGGLVLDDRAVYWSDAAAGTIMKIEL